MPLRRRQLAERLSERVRRAGEAEHAALQSAAAARAEAQAACLRADEACAAYVQVREPVAHHPGDALQSLQQHSDEVARLFPPLTMKKGLEVIIH